jgi:hypothetical protein
LTSEPVSPQAGRHDEGRLDSFIRWCERAREDSAFDAEIQKQLEKREAKIELNRAYRQWLAMQKEDLTAPWSPKDAPPSRAHFPGAPSSR